MTIAIQNQQLYRMCSDFLKIESPNYNDINQVVAQYLSTLTAPMRLPSSQGYNMRTLITNLIPYPRIQIAIPSLGHLVPIESSF
jgi:tubulin alpha